MVFSRNLFFLCPAVALVLTVGLMLSCGKKTPDSGSSTDSGGTSKKEIPITPVTSLKVMSFNILRGDFKGENQIWENRKPGVLAMLEDEQPMVFGLQECTYLQRRQILVSNSLLDAYGIAVDGQTSGYTTVSSNPIFYRKDILELEEKGTFWLSDNPEVPGSICWGTTDNVTGGKPRTCTWARFKVRCNDFRFYYFNAHLHNGSTDNIIEGRKKSIQLIISRMEEADPSNQMAFLFGGDMNALKTEESLVLMGKKLFHAPTKCETTDGGRTFNGFSTSGGSPIDHLFYSGSQFIGMEFKVNRKAYAGVTYLSDHYPVFCELNFK